MGDAEQFRAIIFACREVGKIDFGNRADSSNRKYAVTVQFREALRRAAVDLRLQVSEIAKTAQLSPFSLF